MHFVFVHLGSAPCRWLIPNILDHSLRFEEETVLLADDPDLIRVARRNGVNVVPIAVAETELTDYQSREFRSKFWTHTTTRFLAIAQYQLSIEQPILHVESDVVLMDDLQTQLILENAGSVAFSQIAPAIGVGALVFFRNAHDSQWLSNALMGHGTLSSSNNDMHRLGRLAESNEQIVSLLPSASSHRSSLFRSRIPNEFRMKASANFSLFGGIFDGATIGQYLFGLDPRNHRGARILGFSPPDHAIDANRAVYFTDGASLLALSQGDTAVPILSLHIHSKDIRMFYAKSRKSLIEKRVSEQFRGQRSEFDLLAFSRFAREYSGRAIRKISDRESS